MFTIVILKSKEKIYFYPLRNLFLSIKNWIRITSLLQNLGVAYFPYSSPHNVSNSSKWDWHTNHNLMSFNGISLPPTDIKVNLHRHDNPFLSFDVFQLYHTFPLKVIVERRQLVKNDFK